MGVSKGNFLGSNILNICLILGISILLLTLRHPKSERNLPKTAKEELGSLHFGLLIASMVPLALIYMGCASRFLGVILFAIFLFYMYQLSKARTPEEKLFKTEKSQLDKYVLLLGAVGVIICAYFIVESASYIALKIGIPRVVTGARVAAFGTSVPELATRISAVKQRHLDIALGNIVGSFFMNITLILGVTLISLPLSINFRAFSNLALFSLITNLLIWYFLSGERIGRREGIVLLFMYAFLSVSLAGLQVSQTA